MSVDIRTLIREAVQNELLLKNIVRRMLRDMQKITPLTRAQVEYDDKRVGRELVLKNIAEVNCVPVEKVIQRYEEEMRRNGFIMGHEKFKRQNIHLDDELNIVPQEGYSVELRVALKDAHTQRIKPQRYVYHFSPFENRASILKDGLKPSAWGDGGHWAHSANVAHDSAVFAVNDENDSWGKKSWDRWQIDTSAIPNKWWHDMNFKDRHDLIMTHEAIPPDAIRLT